MSHAGAQAGTFTVAEDTWGSPYAAITAAVSDTSTNNPPDTSGGAGFDGEAAGDVVGGGAFASAELDSLSASMYVARRR